MSRTCAICGKSAQNGNKVSHANNKTHKLWQPNLQTVRLQAGDTVVKARVCTQCIKSGLVTKPAIKVKAVD